ncbi:protein-L-isoaspartate(D-aspartate) O-methyltransferase [Candidatus Palauibacter sp.]|uniref:protein-L-isoaspartate(D-aspartate) O-methyltransferase n=1 Tax=Candidatus Palauibacter sp. TaxID=3101350 RepID=UPI003B5C022B
MGSGELTARDLAADFRRDRQRLVEHLRAGGIRDLALLHAFARVPRHAFVPEIMIHRAYDDVPLPIGAGQTISSPTIHALSIAAAEVGAGQRILEVGTGAGFQTALLAKLGAEVYSIERVQSLHESAARTLSRLGVKARLMLGDGNLGWPGPAPFQAIIVCAATARPPTALLEQLADGGHMIVPVGTRRQELRRYTRRGDEFLRKKIARARFVPLIDGNRPGRRRGRPA